MTYTKEEKNQYFQELRSKWLKAKELCKTEEAKAVYQSAQLSGVNVSMTGFYFTLMQMEQLGLDGTPYIDTKTFNGWKSSGYKVKRGEHSKIDGITWIGTKDEDGLENRSNVYPKEYHLFHKTQVEQMVI